MKIAIIYLVIGLLLGSLSIPMAVKKVKKDYEGGRDLFSQAVNDYAGNQIIYLIMLVIITFFYPVIFITAFGKLIKQRMDKK